MMMVYGSTLRCVEGKGGGGRRRGWRHGAPSAQLARIRVARFVSPAVSNSALATSMTKRSSSRGPAYSTTTPTALKKSEYVDGSKVRYRSA